MQPLSVTTSDATGGEVESDWIMCDAWTPGLLSIQVDVYNTGGGPAISYSVYTTLDDPNDPMSPVPVVDMTWLPTSITTMVSSLVSASGYSAYTPRYVKLVQHAGDGSAKMTICQAGAVPQ